MLTGNEGREYPLSPLGAMAFHWERGEMGKGRQEGFSDGVLAIIITIMIMIMAPEMKAPPGSDLNAPRQDKGNKIRGTKGPREKYGLA